MEASITMLYAYAYRNGYKGSYDDYIQQKYNAYLKICIRCDVKDPMSVDQWIYSKRDYIQQKYNAYLDICNQCDIKDPMSIDQWIYSKRQ